MADALSGLTEVSGTIEAIVSATVQEVLTAEAIMPPLVSDWSSMAGPGMDRVKIPRFSNFTVNTKSENVAVDAQVNAFSTDDLIMDKHKVVQWLLEDIANLQSKVAVTQAYIQQSAKDLAAEMDQTILDALEAGASAAAPDHRIAYTDGVNNDIEKADILNARKLLNIAKVPMADRAMVISPAQEAFLLAIGEFVKVNESGSEASLRNGLIGKLFGFDCYVSPLAEDLKSMFFHKSALAFARQLAPRYKTQDDLANLGVRHSVDHIYGCKVLDSGKRIVLVGTAA